MLFLCYSNGMDRLVHTFIDTVTLFISQNDQLKINQTGFRSCPSNETALLSVTIALQIAKADSKSSVLILLVLSATFDTVNHQIFLLPSQELHSTGLNLISQVGLSGFPGRRGIQSTSTGHWGSSGISSWTPPLHHIHYITGTHYTSTWFLLPLLCWWHTALSFISTRQSNSSCMDLRLPGKHLGMDEGTSPAAQPGKEWASCLPCHSDFTAWFHHPTRNINNYSLVTSWPARTTL